MGLLQNYIDKHRNDPIQPSTKRVVNLEFVLNYLESIPATQTTPGLMSVNDKIYLDGLDTGASIVAESKRARHLLSYDSTGAVADDYIYHYAFNTKQTIQKIAHSLNRLVKVDSATSAEYASTATIADHSTTSTTSTGASFLNAHLNTNSPNGVNSLAYSRGVSLSNAPWGSTSEWKYLTMFDNDTKTYSQIATAYYYDEIWLKRVINGAHQSWVQVTMNNKPATTTENGCMSTKDKEIANQTIMRINELANLFKFIVDKNNEYAFDFTFNDSNDYVYYLPTNSSYFYCLFIANNAKTDFCYNFPGVYNGRRWTLKPACSNSYRRIVRINDYIVVAYSRKSGNTVNVADDDNPIFYLFDKRCTTLIKVANYEMEGSTISNGAITFIKIESDFYFTMIFETVHPTNGTNQGRKAVGVSVPNLDVTEVTVPNFSWLEDKTISDYP